MESENTFVLALLGGNRETEIATEATRGQNPEWEQVLFAFLNGAGAWIIVE